MSTGSFFVLFLRFYDIKILYVALFCWFILLCYQNTIRCYFFFFLMLHCLLLMSKYSCCCRFSSFLTAFLRTNLTCVCLFWTQHHKVNNILWYFIFLCFATTPVFILYLFSVSFSHHTPLPICLQFPVFIHLSSYFFPFIVAFFYLYIYLFLLLRCKLYFLTLFYLSLPSLPHSCLISSLSLISLPPPFPRYPPPLGNDVTISGPSRILLVPELARTPASPPSFTGYRLTVITIASLWLLTPHYHHCRLTVTASASLSPLSLHCHHLRFTIITVIVLSPLTPHCHQTCLIMIIIDFHYHRSPLTVTTVASLSRLLAHCLY